MLLNIVVVGIPVSAQSKGKSRKRAWMAKVATAATPAWRGAPLAVASRVAITYFYLSDSLDVDNIVKPILDALIGPVLVDDHFVVEIRAVKRDQAQPFTLAHTTPAILRALQQSLDFVTVSLDTANILDPV
jgi:crossover junction endodeoxyribonuclease RusA